MQEAAINEKIAEVQEKLQVIIKETEGVQNNLRSARNTKGYYKIQLRDLYLRILKNEEYIM